MEQNRNAPVLTKEGILKSYEDLDVNTAEPEISPLLHPSFEGLPLA